ncbi:ribonuclease inhibitor isoform X1 [Malurus melanocephalus]|uniref:ribonuclease inhibitor isoform X1 n=2 Tax=Malurus melanocephalus TaxID=175006 RepID=UPI00254673B9|nr:ribonuclease inhibitor isoform X1 [Malurus melanocephalus]
MEKRCILWLSTLFWTSRKTQCAQGLLRKALKSCHGRKKAVRAQKCFLPSLQQALCARQQRSHSNGRRKAPALPPSLPAQQRQQQGLTSTVKMDLDIQCEEMNPSRWAELLTTMKSCKTIRMDDCNLSSSNCEDLCSIINTNPSLTELKLNNNELGDAGVEHLCKGLLTPSCSLQKLWLQNCNLTSASCETLCSVLCAQPSLTELHVGDNRLGTTGVRVLCQGMMNPNCKLQKLQLEYCELTADIVEALNAALQSKPTLKELSLSNNTLGDNAVKQLCQGLVDSSCNLELLHLENCGITSDSCMEISTVLKNKPSLMDLSVGDNKIGDTGLALLCQGLMDPNCKIQKLWLWDCDLTSACCKDLSRLILAKDTLKEISLIDNDLRDAGMEMLCQALKDPKSELQELWVRECGLTTDCCKAVSSALTTNKQLKVLHMGENKLGDAGVEILSEGLMHPNCNIQSLWLGNCDLTASCCATLANIMATKPCLTELDLSYNPLGDEGIRKICEAVRKPSCNLQQLILYDIFWSAEVDDELKALEESKPEVKIIS